MDIEKSIREKLLEAYTPDRLEVINESSRHAGHAGDNGTGQTHIHVKIVSAAFTGKSRIARQRMIYDLLKYEFSAGLHALALGISTPEEEIKRNQ